MKQARKLQTNGKVRNHEVCTLSKKQKNEVRKNLQRVLDRLEKEVQYSERKRSFGRLGSQTLNTRVREFILTAKGRKCSFLRGFDCRNLPASSSTSSSGTFNIKLSHFIQEKIVRR